MKRNAGGSKGLHFYSPPPAQHYVGKSFHFRRFRRARVRPLVLVGITLLALFLTGAPGVVRHAGATGWWQPGELTSWAYVIGENYPLTIPPLVNGTATPVQAVDADLGDQDGLASSGIPVADSTIESSVSAIHAMGAHAICYVDAGTAENWRSDYGKFDPSELGGNVPGWPGEEFINAADWATSVPSGYETLQTIMANRIALCQEEGFDAIEADNVDAYSDGNIGDFTLTMAQEETYIDQLVAITHSDGLAFFLKNEINGDSLITTEAPIVDGEIDEQCWQYSECSALDVFVQEGKPLLNVEYQSFAEATLCAEANAFPMATIQAGVDLTGPVNYGCWQYGGGPIIVSGPTTTTGSSTSTTASSTTTTASSTTTTARSTTTTASSTTTTARSTTTTAAPTTTTARSTTTTAAPTTTTVRSTTTTAAPTTTTARSTTTTADPTTTTVRSTTTTAAARITTTTRPPRRHRHFTLAHFFKPGCPNPL